MKGRVLVTGATGMLGSTLVPILRREGYEVHPTDLVNAEEGIEFLDIRDSNEVKRAIRRLRPHYVIHLAAKTDVEKCEVEVEDAYLTNVMGTKNVAEACKETEAIMVYISTAGVFDGKKKEPYTELDQPNPLNVYGRTKLEGEKVVDNMLSRKFIVRTSWLFGGGLKKDKKFVGKLINQILQGKKELHVVTDKRGTPTYTVDLSKMICNLMRTDHFGLYHVACKGRATRFEVAEKVLEYFHIKEIISLIPVDSSYFSRDYFAPRPDSEMLDNYMLRLKGMDNMRSWQEALKEYLQRDLKALKI